MSNEVTHMLKGKPLSECTCEELSAEIDAGYTLEATSDVFTEEQSARLDAVEAAYEAKPEDERLAWEKSCEERA